MKIKVQAHTSDEDGLHFPGEILDMRETKARIWISKGWAVARPDLEPKREEPASEPEPEPEPEVTDDPDEVELAVLPGAPETALSRRGRRKAHK